MNQILHTKNDGIYVKKNNSKHAHKKNKLKFQFSFSILTLFIVFIGYFFNLQAKNSKEYTAQEIKNNYNIEKLYNSDELKETKTYSKGNDSFTIIGMIEIPKINIYYPIISESNDELLKISPCRISGPLPNEDGNLCIAGHNYDNYKFFSKLSNLELNDPIFIYNMSGSKGIYNVFDIYEVNANDLSPLDINKDIKKQVTLITCNNFNSDNRIIIKASFIKGLP